MYIKLIDVYIVGLCLLCLGNSVYGQVDCTDPGTPLNGQQDGSPTFKHGTNVTFSCNTNFTLVGVTTRTCMDGIWSDENPTCHADCMDPGTPTNGEQDDSPTFEHGTNVTFSCNTNYTLVGVTTRTCMDGNWSDENPTCYVNCEHEGQLYTQGSTRQEACNTCTCSNGLWACTQRICLPVDCTDPGTPLNGQQDGSPTFKNGTNATFSCNTNFTLVGVTTRTCMDGTWSDENPTCHADCMDPGTPTNGEQDDSPTFEHGTNVTFSCNTNYTLVGVTTRTCMDGTWSDENPTCYGQFNCHLGNI
ncbi:CUB and sushi domain-containing protein 3-like [Glandiceps talaboti]